MKPIGGQSSIVGKSVFCFSLCAILFALCASVEAQQQAKIPVVGQLGASSSFNNDRADAFRQGMRKLGYVEGKNIVIEWRYAEGKRDRLPALAAELVRLKPDVIVAGGANATRAAKKATSTIPIVMSQSGDPVADGFVASLARPGGNITGLSNLAPELQGKRLELLKEIIPKLSRLAYFATSTAANNAKNLKETEVLAEALGVRIHYLDVLSPKDLEPAFRGANKVKADAVFVQVWGAILNPHRAEFARLAIKNRLPTIFDNPQYVEAGGLVTYGVSEIDLSRRAATYVDKILKGAKPADLPVEQPTKFEFIINLKTAKLIGLTIPPNVLARADKVIK
jgi:ABC-type uncharacterized transport system substrate-binding protein